ncbi:hypothetical protein SAMN04489761_0545 [Tenacibaculum sp. MAR_2009_124]|nr:hypothetical protein SAMN04489761_0545 [Tenacibaculum sp. MAR_2009_124]
MIVDLYMYLNAKNMLLVEKICQINILDIVWFRKM